MYKPNIKNILQTDYIWVIPCQINKISETSPAQFFYFANIFFWRKINMFSD